MLLGKRSLRLTKSASVLCLPRNFSCKKSSVTSEVAKKSSNDLKSDEESPFLQAQRAFSPLHRFFLLPFKAPTRVPKSCHNPSFVERSASFLSGSAA